MEEFVATPQIQVPWHPGTCFVFGHRSLPLEKPGWERELRRRLTARTLRPPHPGPGHREDRTESRCHLVKATGRGCFMGKEKEQDVMLLSGEAGWSWMQGAGWRDGRWLPRRGSRTVGLGLSLLVSLVSGCDDRTSELVASPCHPPLQPCSPRAQWQPLPFHLDHHWPGLASGAGGRAGWLAGCRAGETFSPSKHLIPTLFFWQEK